MDQLPNLNSEKPKSGKPSRRKFLKSAAFLGGAAAGLGKAPLDVAISEMDGNKKREGNSVTITLEDGKKVSLVWGVHSDEFREGQTVPKSDILGLEQSISLSQFFKDNRDISNKDLDSIVATNATPILREMMKSGKRLYHCDLEHKRPKEDLLDSIGASDYELVENYILIALSSMGAASLAGNKSSRREFLKSTFMGLSSGLSIRAIKLNRANLSGQMILKPNDVTPEALADLKFRHFDKNSVLGSTLHEMSKPEMWELEQIIEMVRSVVMALKLKSALRLSEKKSITMAAGAAHIVVEDFVTMSDEDLIKKLIPFKDALKKYADLSKLYILSSAFYDLGDKLNLEEQEDPILRSLVEKYLY